MGTMGWKKGRGKLGIFVPLIGRWRAEADSPMGPVICVRTFERVLDNAYVQLTADWTFADRIYREIAMIGTNADGQVAFWSFTSDNKHSEGLLADVTDLHPQAIGFEAQMPAGVGRMAYWPHSEDGFTWVVESKTKKGWNRFTEHQYKPLE